MQVERLNDESVKLKILQTSLTLMQLPELAQNEVNQLQTSGKYAVEYFSRLP